MEYKLYTVQSLAVLLGITERHARTLIKLGSIDSLRIGHKTVRITPEAVSEFIERKKVLKKYKI